MELKQTKTQTINLAQLLLWYLAK